MSNHHDQLTAFMGIDYHTYEESQNVIFNAPILAYLTLNKKINPWSLYDLGAFGQSLMLAAQDNGIASMPAYGIVKYPKIIRKAMGIPDDEIIAMGIGFGYEDQAKVNHFHSKRRPLEDVLTIK